MKPSSRGNVRHVSKHPPTALLSTTNLHWKCSGTPGHRCMTVGQLMVHASLRSQTSNAPARDAWLVMGEGLLFADPSHCGFRCHFSAIHGKAGTVFTQPDGRHAAAPAHVSYAHIRTHQVAINARPICAPGRCQHFPAPPLVSLPEWWLTTSPAASLHSSIHQPEPEYSGRDIMVMITGSLSDPRGCGKSLLTPLPVELKQLYWCGRKPDGLETV